MEIEEIAEQYSVKDLGRISPAYECGFTQGVNYQKKIDIEKACEWLDDELYHIKSNDVRHPEDIASSTYYNKTDLLEAFRKAMEGKV